MLLNNNNFFLIYYIIFNTYIQYYVMKIKLDRKQYKYYTG